MPSTAPGWRVPCLGHGRHGLASQALPHAGRHLQPAARRDAHDRAAARDALQPRRGAGGDGPDRAARWARPMPAEALYDLAKSLGRADRPRGRRHAARRPGSRGPSSPPRILTSTRGRSTMRASWRCSHVGLARRAAWRAGALTTSQSRSTTTTEELEMTQNKRSQAQTAGGTASRRRNFLRLMGGAALAAGAAGIRRTGVRPRRAQDQDRLRVAADRAAGAVR